MPIGIKIIETASSSVIAASPAFHTVYFLVTSTATTNTNTPIAISTLADFTAQFPGVPAAELAAFKFFLANAPALNTANSSGSFVANFYVVNCDDSSITPPQDVGHYIKGVGELKKRTDLELGIILCPYFSQLSTQGDRTSLFSAIESLCQKLDWVFFFNFATAVDTESEALAERALYVSPYGHSACYYDWIIDTNTDTVGASIAAAAIALLSSAKDSPYAAPAGANYPVAAVTSIPAYVVDETSFGNLRNANINVIQKIPLYGYCLWGARTLASQKKFGQINTRFAISLVSKQLTDALTPFLFEGADPQGFVGREVIRVITAIMEKAWLEGALSGESSDTAYRVVRSQSQIDNLEKLQITIYGRFIGTLEEIEITLINVDVIPQG